MIRSPATRARIGVQDNILHNFEKLHPTGNICTTSSAGASHLTSRQGSIIVHGAAGGVDAVESERSAEGSNESAQSNSTPKPRRIMDLLSAWRTPEVVGSQDAGHLCKSKVSSWQGPPSSSGGEVGLLATRGLEPR